MQRNRRHRYALSQHRLNFRILISYQLLIDFISSSQRLLFSRAFMHDLFDSLAGHNFCNSMATILQAGYYLRFTSHNPGRNIKDNLSFSASRRTIEASKIANNFIRVNTIQTNILRITSCKTESYFVVSGIRLTSRVASSLPCHTTVEIDVTLIICMLRKTLLQKPCFF